MTDALAWTYPNLARWIVTHGWIEVGDDGISLSFVRVLDEGGLIWEGAAAETIDEDLRAADAAVGTRMRNDLGD